MKNVENTIFFVTMGSYDDAEVCELVGIYLLGKLRKAWVYIEMTVCLLLQMKTGLNVIV